MLRFLVVASPRDDVDGIKVPFISTEVDKTTALSVWARPTIVKGSTNFGLVLRMAENRPQFVFSMGKLALRPITTGSSFLVRTTQLGFVKALGVELILDRHSFLLKGELIGCLGLHHGIGPGRRRGYGKEGRVDGSFFRCRSSISSRRSGGIRSCGIRGDGFPAIQVDVVIST